MHTDLLIYLVTHIMALLWVVPAYGVGTTVSVDDLPLGPISKMPTDSLVAMGDRWFLEEDYGNALKAFTVVCRRYDEKSPPEMQAMFSLAFNRYGNILYKRGAYSLSMDAYLQMRRIAENNGLDEDLAHAYVRIGNIYAACGDYSGATDFYTRALAIPELSGSGHIYAMTLNNLFATNLLSGNIEEAERYLQLYRREFGGDDTDPRHRFDILLAEGLIAARCGDSGKALPSLRDALDCAERNGLPSLCGGSAYSSMGDAYLQAGKADSALMCLRRAHEIAELSGNGRLVVETLHDLAEFFDSRHMPDSAYAYRAAYLDMADSISYQEEINKLKSSQMLYELDKSEYTIRSLHMEKRMQATVIWVVAVAASVCIVLVVVLLVQNKKLRAAWMDLYERSTRQLSESMERKKDIMAMGYGHHVAETQDDVAADENMEDETGTRQRKLVLDTDTRGKIATAILEYMDSCDGYCSADFSIERLAGEIGYNPRYVSEVINVVFNKNFRSLLNDYRIRMAMIRLKDNDNYGKFTIKAISESVGYRSQATFISVFTNATGLKPGIYRRLSRE